MARPQGPYTILTPEVQQQIVDAISHGTYLETAAHFAGVSPASLYTWIRRGRAAQDKTAHQRNKGDLHCLAFVAEVERAQATAEVSGVTRVLRAGTMDQVETRVTEVRNSAGEVIERLTVTVTKPPDWRALTWHLERRYRARWAARAAIEVSGVEGKPVALAVGVDAEVAELLAAIGRTAHKLDPEGNAVPEAPLDNG